MNQVIFYTTSGCHLCEQAKAILEPQIWRKRLWLREVDIAESDDLIERYGVRIPVVALSSKSAELNWPFDSEELDAFLRRNLGS